MTRESGEPRAPAAAAPADRAPGGRRRRIMAVLLGAALAAAIALLVLVPPTDPREETSGMGLGEAALLGAVEGITEYLPVSSTGHLLVTQRALGIGRGDQGAKRAADAFAVCIQFGAILAVLGLYAGRIGQMGRGLLGRDAAGARMLRALLVAFAPAAAAGLLAGDEVKEHLFGPWPVVAAWAVGGALILVVATMRRDAASSRDGLALERIGVRIALLVGLAQCVALWPGVSRSLTTIVAGLLAGLSLGAAVEFSFLLGVVTLGAATLHDAVRHGDTLLEVYSVPSLVVGLSFAFVSAVLAVRWLVRWIERHGLALFGWYRLAIAALTAAFLLAGG